MDIDHKGGLDKARYTRRVQVVAAWPEGSQLSYGPGPHLSWVLSALPLEKK